MTISWMDPHTTSKESRSCIDCHTDPKALGLGAGSLVKIKGSWRLVPATSKSRDRRLNIPRLDGFVDISGKPLVLTSRKDLRPFDAAELKRILDVGQCLICHRDFDDKVMKNWNSLSPPKPCKFFLKTR